MAGPRGDKVGDAWIKVTPIIDEKAVNQAESRAEKAARRARERMDRELGTQFQRQAEAQARLRRMIEEQNAGLRDRQLREETRAQDRIRDVRNRSERDQHRNFRRYLFLRIKLEQQAALAREKIDRKSAQVRAQLENSLERARIIRQRIAERNARRAGGGSGGGRGPFGPGGGGGDRGGGGRGGRGGSVSRGSAFENLASILPGQLEKLLRVPGIGPVAGTIGAAIATELVSGMAGALGAAVAGGTLFAGFAGAIAGDPELQKAGKALGTRFVDGFLEVSSTLRDEVAASFDQIEQSGFIERLNVRFRNVLDALAPEIAPFIDNLISGFDQMTEGISDFAENAGPLIDSVGRGIDTLGGAVGGFFKDLEASVPEITESLDTLFQVLSGIVTIMGTIIKLSSSVTSTLKSLVPTEIASNPAKIFGGGGGFLGDITRFATKQVTGVDIDALNLAAQEQAGKAKASADFVKAQAEEARAADATSRSLEGQAAAYKAAHDAQLLFDRSIVTSLDHKIAYEEAIDDIAKAVKAVGNDWRLTKPAVRDAINVAKTSLGDYKESLMNAVKEGKITREQAVANFNKMASNTVAKFGKGSEARAAVAEFAGSLKTFPKTIDVKVKVSSNIQSILNQLAGLRTSAGQQIKAQVQVDRKNKANGGPIYGPGTGTSDSIPANLSNGEFVIKASSAKKIGMGNLARMNDTGKMPQGFATGGSVRGQGRGKTASQVAQFNALNKQIVALGKTLTKFNDVVSSVSERLDAFTGLNAVGEGLTAAQVVESVQNRRKKAESFTKSIEVLKKKGLTGQALQDLVDRGPESNLAETLAKTASSAQIAAINSALGGDAAEGRRIGEVLVPGGTKAAAEIAAKKKQAAKLAPPKAKGATISYAGGKTTALFSKQELLNQQLKAGTYVTVIIDGKEVRAIVKEEQTKAQAKANQKLSSGRR